MDIRRLENQIESYQNFHDPNPDEDFLKEAYKYLIAKQYLFGHEHRFLCWLKFQFDYEVNLSLPFVVTPQKISLDKFKMNYLKSEKRKELYNNLVKFTNKVKEKANTESITTLIGGSFTKSENDLPNDIDIAILISDPESYEACDKKKLQALGLDLTFLSEELNMESFKVFTNIIMLGNDAEKKDKSDNCFVDNSFTRRLILKLEL